MRGSPGGGCAAHHRLLGTTPGHVGTTYGHHRGNREHRHATAAHVGNDLRRLAARRRPCFTRRWRCGAERPPQHCTVQCGSHCSTQPGCLRPFGSCSLAAKPGGRPAIISSCAALGAGWLARLGVSCSARLPTRQPQISSDSSESSESTPHSTSSACTTEANGTEGVGLRASEGSSEGPGCVAGADLAVCDASPPPMGASPILRPEGAPPRSWPLPHCHSTAGCVQVVDAWLLPQQHNHGEQEQCFRIQSETAALSRRYQGSPEKQLREGYTPR